MSKERVTMEFTHTDARVIANLLNIDLTPSDWATAIDSDEFFMGMQRELGDDIRDQSLTLRMDTGRIVVDQLQQHPHYYSLANRVDEHMNRAHEHIQEENRPRARFWVALRRHIRRFLYTRRRQ